MAETDLESTTDTTTNTVDTATTAATESGASTAPSATDTSAVEDVKPAETPAATDTSAVEDVKPAETPAATEVAKEAEAAPTSAPAPAPALAPAPDVVVEEVKTTETVVELLNRADFKGTVIGSGSLYGAQANKLLNAVRDGSLDYVIVSTTARNGIDRAVIVGEKLFTDISKLLVFNTIKKPLAWVLQAPSLSRDDLFVGNTALEIVTSPLQRPGVASVLLQTDVVFGYIIGASDFHAAFKA